MTSEVPPSDAKPVESPAEAKPGQKFSVAGKPANAAPPVGKPAAIAPPKAAQKDDDVDDSAKEAPSTVEAKVDPDANETKLFEQKAVLYRFDKPANDWKERGIGFMKILKNPETGRCRVVMRRIQTFKVCANHFILPGMVLKSNGEKAVIWHATDFADGKESHEILSVKFKNAEIVSEFRAAFEAAQVQNQALGATGGEST
jgi:hypothetical protein